MEKNLKFEKFKNLKENQIGDQIENQENQMEKNFDEIKNYIVDYISRNGPSLPSSLASKIGKPLLITNAILSQLVEEGLLKATFLKIGSSSLYYVSGQEPALEKFLSYLKDKEKEAIELLKSSRLLEHEKLEPAIRVALSNLKDFAKPIKIAFDGGERIFWKYYLVGDEELNTLIKNFKEKEKERKEGEKEEKEIARAEEKIEKAEKIEKGEIEITKEKEEKEKEKAEEEKEKVEKIAKVEKIEKIEKEKLLQKPLTEFELKEEKKKEKLEKKIGKEREGKKEEKKEEKEERGGGRIGIGKESKKESEKEGKLESYKRWIESNFVAIERLGPCIYKGKKEIFDKLIEFLIIINDKKRISDVDLILALQEGQERKMPTMLLTNGVLTKKASEVLKKSGSLLIIKNLNQ